MTKTDDPGRENDDPVALITGGSSGIGLATAIQLAKNGYRIAICGRNSERLEAAAESIRALGGLCLPINADLNNPASTDDIVRQTLGEFGRIDVLVNNAGFAPLAPFSEIDAETFETVINTNIRSIFYLTQTVWGIMTRRGTGVIVNISSLSAIDPFPGFSLYGASKAWLDLMTHALAAEGAGDNIRVYSIRPGAVETPLLRGLFPDFPAEQCVSPDQVATQVWNCISKPSEFESGQAINVTKQESIS